MKTAISIPDETFQDAERCADALGMSRSEFFTVAARHYIDELDAQSLTSRIDAAIGRATGPRSGSGRIGSRVHPSRHRCGLTSTSSCSMRLPFSISTIRRRNSRPFAPRDRYSVSRHAS